jgi:hypothetical protein
MNGKIREDRITSILTHPVDGNTVEGLQVRDKISSGVMKQVRRSVRESVHESIRREAGGPVALMTAAGTYLPLFHVVGLSVLNFVAFFPHWRASRAMTPTPNNA